MGTGIKIGDRVKVPFGSGKADGLVVADRGPVGGGGRHLYQVDLFQDPFEPITYVLLEEDMEVARGSPKDEVLDPEQVLEYLIHGGLILILMAYRFGEGHQPRVWLSHDMLGNITHTYAQERGVLGGGFIPARAVHESRVVANKRDEVLTLLRSFGLTRKQAKDVVAKVGTTSS